MLALVRGERRLGGMIVAAQQQRAALGMGALEIRRLDRLARALDADAFGIPQREDAIDAGLAIPAKLLGAAQAEVAASSSLRPGSKRMSCWESSASLAHSCASSVVTGEPR